MMALSDQSLYAKARSGNLKTGVLVSLIFHLFLFSVLVVMGNFRFSKPVSDFASKPIEVRVLVEKPTPQKPTPQKPAPQKPVPPKPVQPEKKKKPLDLTLPTPAPQPPAPKPPAPALQPPAPQSPSMAKSAPLPPVPKLGGPQTVKARSFLKGRVKGKKGIKKPVLHKKKGAFKVRDEGMKGGLKQRLGARGTREDTLAQSDRDFLLAQILQYWRYNYTMPSEKNFVLRGGVMVRKDGTLAPPFNKAQHWNPQGAFAQYAVANEQVRKILESFYLALRMAQPLEIPPGMKGPWPRFTSLSFRFQDLPKYQYR